MPQPEGCAEEGAGTGLWETQPGTGGEESRRACVLADSVWDRNEHCPLCLSTPSSLRSERELPGWRWTLKPDQQRGGLAGGESMEVVVVQFEKVGSEHEQRAKVVSCGNGAQRSLLMFHVGDGKPC